MPGYHAAMLSLNTLSALSSVPPASPARPASLARPVRTVSAAPPQPLAKLSLPPAVPSGYTPRGSLLNLSV